MLARHSGPVQVRTCGYERSPVDGGAAAHSLLEGVTTRLRSRRILDEICRLRCASVFSTRCAAFAVCAAVLLLRHHPVCHCSCCESRAALAGFRWDRSSFCVLLRRGTFCGTHGRHSSTGGRGHAVDHRVGLLQDRDVADKAT